MKIFFITSRVPYPITKGDKLRAYNFLKLLKKRHEVILYSLDYENISINSEMIMNISDYFYVRRLSKLRMLGNLVLAPIRRLPFQVSLFYSRRTKIDLEKCINHHNPDIIFCQLIRSVELVTNLKGKTKILDYVDAISEGLLKRAKNSGFFMKFFLMLEYKKICIYEETAYNSFEKKIIITEQDKQSLSFKDKNDIQIIPNGIDIEYFAPQKVEKEYDLIFTGNMNYAPNIYAAQFIVNELLPLLRKIKPDIRLLILGADTSKKVSALKCKYVEIKSWVDDIREYYAKSRVFIAPLKIGTGLQNKLLEAMSMGLPSITTGIVQRAINAPIHKTLLIAETPGEFVESIITLLNNQEMADTIGYNARNFVTENFTWNHIEKQLDKLISE